MIDIFSNINLLQNLSAIELNFIMLGACYILLIIFVRFFSLSGLYIYSCLSVIIANIQVLKASYLFDYTTPVALGTIVYTTSFLASDIINEFYGIKAAKKTVGLSFLSSFMIVILMCIAISYPSIETNSASQYQHFIDAHNAINIIFKPSISIFISSLIAFGISQFFDIYIFAKLKNLYPNSLYWLRVILSVLLATLIDAIIFNFLAWKVFNDTKINWSSLIYSYILFNYVVQIAIACCNLPVFYIIKYMLKKDMNTPN